MTWLGWLGRLFKRHPAPLGAEKIPRVAEYKPHVAFDTDISTDAVEDDGGTKFLVWGGENLANIVSEMLRAEGYEVSVPVSAEHAGWEFQARKGQDRFWLRVCEFDETRRYLVTKDLFANWRREAHAQFVSLIDEALRADRRFYNISWFDQSGSPDADEPGWPHPTQSDRAGRTP